MGEPGGLLSMGSHRVGHDWSNLAAAARTKYFTVSMVTQKTLNSQSNHEKEEWSWKNQPSWLQKILESYNHQERMEVAQKHKYRLMEQDRKPKLKPCICGHLNFDKRGKNIQWRKTASSISGDRKTKQLHVKEWLEHFLTLYTKINSKWIKDLNTNSENIKLVEENIGSIHFDINGSKILFYPSPRIIEIKIKISKVDLIKLENFFTAKETVNEIKRPASELEKIMQMKQLTKD